MVDNELMKDGSGYNDPTAYAAIKNIEGEDPNAALMEYAKEYEKYQKLVGCILRICELSDFHLEERLVLKDKKTGRIYR